MQNDPSWLKIAYRFNGVAEIKGPHHNSAIIDLLDIADGADDGKPLQGIADDETPWCATFVSAVLELDGIKSMRSAWARSYLKFGFKLAAPARGAIAVLERGEKSGHVAFVVGRDQAGNIMLLGGNQSDQVKVSAFPIRRVLDYRWPMGTAMAVKEMGFATLPLMDGDGRVSSSEA